MSVAGLPAALLDATAALIEAGPDVGRQFDAGLQGMIRLLDADRGDSGFITARSSRYRPSHHQAEPDVPAPPFEVPLDDPLVQTVLGSAGAFLVEDVQAELPGGPVRDVLTRTDTRSIVVQRLAHNDEAYGLVCIDWVGRSADVSNEALELMDFYVTRVWTPLLLRAAEEGAACADGRLASLTASELAVAQLAAAGLSYREIAATRGTSINTISQQLRSARRKVEASNTTELCTLVGPPDRSSFSSQDPAIEAGIGPGVRFDN